MTKAVQAEGVEWGEDYRGSARQALVELLEGRMGQLIDEHLERMAEVGQADRPNGCYRRHVLMELGDIELAVPCTRSFNALKVVHAYARRAKEVNRMILVRARAQDPPGRSNTLAGPRPSVSPATVRVHWQLASAVAALQCRPLKDQYPVLVLDGVVLKRKIGAGALARPYWMRSAAP